MKPLTPRPHLLVNTRISDIYPPNIYRRSPIAKQYKSKRRREEIQIGSESAFSFTNWSTCFGITDSGIYNFVHFCSFVHSCRTCKYPLFAETDLLCVRKSLYRYFICSMQLNQRCGILLVVSINTFVLMSTYATYYRPPLLPVLACVGNRSHQSTSVVCRYSFCGCGFEFCSRHRCLYVP